MRAVPLAIRYSFQHYMANFGFVRKVETRMSRTRDFARSWDKTSDRLVNKGFVHSLWVMLAALCYSIQHHTTCNKDIFIKSLAKLDLEFLPNAAEEYKYLHMPKLLRWCNKKQSLEFRRESWLKLIDSVYPEIRFKKKTNGVPIIDVHA